MVKVRMKETLKKRFLCILAVVFIISGNVPVHAAAQTNERETIKAGFFAWDGYHVEDENGLRSGYGYDFLKMTENYCNWKIDFVGYDKTWADMLAMLDHGEIDLLTSAQKTPEWESRYDFSSQPIGSSATVLSVRKEETQYIVGNPKTYDGMIIGCLSGSSRNDKFAEYAQNHHFSFQYVWYNDLADLKQALADKEVDGILSTNLRTFNGETVLEQFDPTDYYVIVKKGNDKLLNQVNHAIDEMNYNTPSWKEQLQNQYFTSSAEKEMVFTADELEYLEQQKEKGTVFTVVTNPDLAPYSSYDSDGKAIGIAPDLFCEIADRIGLNYQFQSFETYEEYNSFVRSGKADIDLTCFHDYGLAAQHGINLTNPYMTTSLAMVSGVSFTGTVKKVAEVEGSDHNTIYSEGLYDNTETLICASNAEAIKAVTDGKADAAYQYTYMAQKSVENDVRNRLAYSVLPQYQISICIGTNENRDYRLTSILNEGIRALSGTYTEHMIQKNIAGSTKTPGLLDFIYDYPIYAIWGIIFLVLIVLTILYFFARKKQTEQELLAQSENSRARTEFFLLISHEIRTPLNAVVSYLRMIKEEYNIEAGAESYLEKARAAAMQLAEISDNMQDYSKISTGTVELKDEIIKLKDVILRLDQIISVKAKEKSQNYSFEISNLTRQYLMGDSLRVTLIYQNILENAVKFTQKGGTIQAKLEEKCIDQENVNLIFTCKDTGKGMTQEFTKKINTAFHQSDASYSRTHGGLGLGLFLTQYFIKMMNGTFEVTSTEGEGSAFTVVLPMKSPRIERLQENGIKCRPIRAIVCETNEYDIQMAKDTLKTIGIKVDVVNDTVNLSKKIQSRLNGPYQYALCIINVDVIKNYKDVIHTILNYDSGLEFIGITGEESQIARITDEPEIAHAVLKQRSYFELFNAVITDFGEEAEKAETGKQIDYSNVHALIAEDNPINADILSKILEKKEIKSTICQNGKIALETFKEAPDNTYQIIFMDIQMPEMDGLEATREIRRCGKKQGADIPIVAVSANAFPEDVKKSLAAGMNEHIAKPVDKMRLFGEIEKYCSKNVVEMQKTHEAS